MGRMSGLIAYLLSFKRVLSNGAKVSDVKVDTGGGDILTAHHTAPPGDDSFPLPDDQLALVRIPRSGRVVVIGYVEPDALQKATAGDKRIYARSSDRLEVIELWLKNDGTGLLSNDNGSFTLRPDGSTIGENNNGSYELRANGSFRAQNGNGFHELREDGTVEINGATIDPSGNIIATSVKAPSIVVDNKELKDHGHNILGGSSASPPPTGPNN